ncbi:ABC transporter ATP-binding protein [Enterococcus sp. LJL128]
MTKKDIEINCICKSHKARKILKNISFTAEAGKITAFLGENGAGKSSTLRILLGLDRQQSGSATFSGRKYAEMTMPLKTVGAVFDGIGGIPSRKVRTHLKIIAQSNSIPKEKIAEVLKQVGLSDKKQARLETLSLGEGQRLSLAAALLGDPQYLVLDEPLNGLDPSGIRWLRKLLRRLAKEGKTILLSSHILSEVEELADRAVIIHQGELAASWELTAMRQEEKSLEEIFFSLTEQEETE